MQALLQSSMNGMQVLASKGHGVMLHGLGTSEVVQSALQTCCDAALGVVLVSCRYNMVSSLLYTVGDAQGVFHHHGADLCDPNQIGDMFRYIEEKYTHSPDILVNNAGVERITAVYSVPSILHSARTHTHIIQVYNILVL